MISIINNNEGVVYSNPYPGMSLSEACGAMELYTERALNEFQMGILLDEHAYLYANGTELDYVEEAGKLEALKDKFINFVKGVARKIKELWDKLIRWISEQITKVSNVVRTQLLKMNAKKIDAVTEVFEKVYPDGLEIKWKSVVDRKELASLGDKCFDLDNALNRNNEISPVDYFESATKSDITDTVDKEKFEADCKAIFDNTGKEIINDIVKKKKSCDRFFADLILGCAKLKGEEADKAIVQYQNAIKWNNGAVHEYIRLVHIWVSNVITEIYTVLRDSKINAAIKSDKKAEAEAKRASAKEKRTSDKDYATAMHDASKAAVAAKKNITKAEREADKKKSIGESFRFFSVNSDEYDW